MKKYDYVEDYLEVISGLRDPQTLKPAGLGWFDPIINLARYDVSVMQNMSDATMNGTALTQRQGELAVRIVEKYRRQLAGVGIDARKENLTEFRQQFRVIDEAKKVDVVDDEIIMKFNYDQNLIHELREFSKASQGKCRWDHDHRAWRLALTEYNINWTVAWAELHGFEISDQARKFNDLVMQTESQRYSIELQHTTDDKFTITNASDSLSRYIQQYIGEMHEHNIIDLIDQSAVLGYSVSDDIANSVADKFGKVSADLLLNSHCQCDNKDLIKAIQSIKHYAAVTKRYPIVIYEPDLSNRLLSAIKEVFAEDEIDVLGNSKKNKEFAPGTKVVHSIRPITQHRIPLLITAAGVITGGERQMMLQNSEKVVFFSAGVYNSKKKSKISHL